MEQVIEEYGISVAMIVVGRMVISALQMLLSYI